MGNNAAYSSFEEITVGLHKLGRLDKKVLTKVIMPAFAQQDCDSGGSGGFSSDGMMVEEIVVRTMRVKLPTRPELPKDRQWTLDQEGDNERWHDRVGDAFGKICNKFDW